MNRLLLLPTLLAICSAAWCQQSKIVVTPSSESYDITIHAQFDKPQTGVATLRGGSTTHTFNTLSLDGCSQSAAAIGCPALPLYRATIEIPACDSIALTITTTTTTFTPAQLALSYPLLPVQPHRSKADTTLHAACIDSAVYASNLMYRLPTATIRAIGTYRDRRLATLAIAPLAYNPATGETELCSQVEVKIHYVNADRTATEETKWLHYSPQFDSRSHLLYSIPMAQKGNSERPVRYTIVAHSLFRGMLDDFAAQKRRQGYTTDIVYTDSLGNTRTAITNYLKSQYTNATVDNPAPTYVLLVGDHTQINAHSSQLNIYSLKDHVTDLYFFTWGSGYLPSCYYGRLSANSADELQPQLDKIILYEDYLFADPSFLSNAALVAGSEYEPYSYDNAYSYADPSMDYVASRYIDKYYQHVSYYKNNTDNHPSGLLNTTVGSSQSSSCSSQLASLYNSGMGWVNYSGHGLTKGFDNPGFYNDNAAAMTNYGKAGVMIGNACLTGNFAKNCFGEQLLRRSNLAGATAYIGASDETYWNEDFYWAVGFRSLITANMHAQSANYNSKYPGAYDLLYHTESQPYTQWRTTLGQMIQAGNISVANEDDEEYVHFYWEIYHLLGDPAMQPWLGLPTPIELDIMQPVALGNLESPIDIDVTTSPYARLALIDSHTGRLLDAATADADGTAQLTLQPDDYTADHTLRIYATAQNRIPASQTVQFDTSGCNYTLRLSHLRTHNCTAGDTARLSFDLTNLTADTLHSINYLVRGLATQLTPLAETEYVYLMPPGQTAHCNMVCPMLLAGNLADQSSVAVTLQVFHDSTAELHNITLPVDAPQLEISGTSNQGLIARGQRNSVSITLHNAGHATAYGLRCTLSDLFNLVDTDTTAATVDSLAPGYSTTLTFSYTPRDTIIDHLQLAIVIATANSSLSLPFTVNLYSEDFENRDLLHQRWHNNSDYPWYIDTTVAYSGTCSARSASNMPNNKNTCSELVLDFCAKHDDSVSFYYIVSSEEDYDTFSFYIDNLLQFTASGTDITNWRRAAYAVSSGAHTLTFSYKKNKNLRYGSDCVWIDALMLPDTAQSVDVKVYDTTCLGLDYWFRDMQLSTAYAGTRLYHYASADTLYQLYLTIVTNRLQILCNDTAVLVGQETYLTATGANSYLWSTGETTPSITVRPTQRTTYTVSTTMGQCVASASITIGTRPLGITTAAATQGAVELYPNPATSVLNIRAEAIGSLALYNAKGVRLLDRRYPAGTTQVALPIQQLPAGIYLLHINNSSHTFIKQGR